jgi:hypothetical protein
MLIALAVPRLAAQQAPPPVYQVLPRVGDGAAKADSAAPVQAQLPCPDCNPSKQGLRGFGELMIVQAVPSLWNNIRRGEVWAKISPRTWYDNIQYPWQWDDNAFLNNQFSHPYHGTTATCTTTLAEPTGTTSGPRRRGRSAGA